MPAALRLFSGTVAAVSKGSVMDLIKRFIKSVPRFPVTTLRSTGGTGAAPAKPFGMPLS